MLIKRLDHPSKGYFKRVHGLVHVEGWCFDSETGEAPEKVFIQIGRRIIEPMIRSRGDVAEKFSSSFENSEILETEGPPIGYEARFQMGNGLRRICVKALIKGREVTLHSRLVWFNKRLNPKQQLKDYEGWIQRYDTLKREREKRLRKELSGCATKPTISLLMPTYNTPVVFLAKAIESVRCQWYSNWELCIADDASTDQRVVKLLKRYARKDPRIKVTFRSKNGHISEASNNAFTLSTGEWIALLDHDDELRPHSLLEVVKHLNRHPGAKFLYSDEDKIDEKGKRYTPHFKTCWNPELLLGQNYICHLSVFQRSLFEKVGGFRKGLEGVQDWDLFLRLTENLKDEEIIHIPEILYHWRMIEGSTATSTEAKSYVEKAAKRMFADFFIRKGLSGNIVPVKGGHWRVKWAEPENPPKVCVIIPTKDHYKLLRSCLDSVLKKTTYANFEILVIDNDSTDPRALAYLKEVESDKVRVIPYRKPFNYSRISNFAVSQTEAEYVLLLNNDVEVIEPDWMGELVRQASRKKIGCVGAKLLYFDDCIQHAGVVTGIGGVAGHWLKTLPDSSYGYFNQANLVRAYSAVTAACLLVKKSIYEEVGGFDDQNLTVAYNDVDFCLKVREAGYRNLYTPFAKLYHYESRTRGRDESLEKRKRAQAEIQYMKNKWGHSLFNDPYHNPNISLMQEQFSFAYPPLHRLVEFPEDQVG